MRNFRRLVLGLLLVSLAGCSWSSSSWNYVLGAVQ